MKHINKKKYFNILFDKIERLEKTVAELGEKISALEEKIGGTEEKKAAALEEKNSGAADVMVVLEDKDGKSVTVAADCIIDAFWIWEVDEAAMDAVKSDLSVVGFAVDYTTPENIWDPKAEAIGERYKMREDVKHFIIMAPEEKKDPEGYSRGIDRIKNLVWKIRETKWPGFVRDVTLSNKWPGEKLKEEEEKDNGKK